MNPFREFFVAMNEVGIRYLIVGGLAVNLHGYRRFTGDIDILLALDVTNLEKVTQLMHDLGYIERLPITLRDLSDAEHVQRLLEEKGMTAHTFLSNKRERIDVDILAAKSLNFSDFDNRKVLIDIDEGVQVPVVSLDDLISMKREANRPQDVQDIQMLLELKSL